MLIEANGTVIVGQEQVSWCHLCVFGRLMRAVHSRTVLEVVLAIQNHLLDELLIWMFGVVESLQMKCLNFIQRVNLIRETYLDGPILRHKSMEALKYLIDF